jgi:hypothetical protein
LGAARCVYNTIIQPIFDYADISWGAMLQTCKDLKIERHVLFLKVIEQKIASLRSSGSIFRQGEKFIIYKILHGIAPTYLDNYFVKNVNIHNFNTRRKENVVLPRVNRELGKKTFRFHGAKYYNELPTEIKNCLILSSFKSRIK